MNPTFTSAKIYALILCMAATKQPDFTELNALAIEACDMWQEHLSSLANDPKARAELTRFLEPQRRLFADWASMMQKGASPSPPQAGGSHDNSQRAQNSNPTKPEPAQPEPASPPRGDEHGGDALRVAQLAYRVAELEKRIAQLESGLARATRGTQRTTS